MENKQIAIIGAGPIGLYTSILIAKKNPNVNILIFEKRNTYTRNHLIKLCRFNTFSKLPEFNEIKKKWRKEKISICDIQNYFINFINDNHKNIKIINMKINSINDIKILYSNIIAIIDASGAHSLFNKNISSLLFNYNIMNSFVLTINYNYILHISLLLKYRISKYLNSIVNIVSKKKNNEHIISLFFFINDNEYNEIKNTFENRRGTLNDLINNNGNFKNKIIKVTSFYLNNNFNNCTFSAFPLYFSALKNFMNKKNNIYYFCCGDSAISIPFQLSLKVGSKVSEYVADDCTCIIQNKNKIILYKNNIKYYFLILYYYTIINIYSISINLINYYFFI